MNKLQKQVEKLGSEKGALQRERSELQKQCGELAGAVDKLNKDKVSLRAGWRRTASNASHCCWQLIKLHLQCARQSVAAGVWGWSGLLWCMLA
jgi:chromosome segregation ATPase